MRVFGIAVITGAVVLAGCSGGLGANFGVAHPVAFSTLTAEATAMGSKTVTGATATLPSSTTASYDGIVVVADELGSAGSTTAILGDARLDATFAAATVDISGTGSNFYQTSVDASNNVLTSGTAVTGSLAFSGTSLGASFTTLGVTGTVNLDGNDVTMNAGQNLTGGFLDTGSGSADQILAIGNDLATSGSSVDVFLLVD